MILELPERTPGGGEEVERLRGGLFLGICPVWIALGESLGVKRERGRLCRLPVNIMSLVNLDLQMSDFKCKIALSLLHFPLFRSLCGCVCVQ